jgi:outer membrane receptor protein involved in Fe transport
MRLSVAIAALCLSMTGLSLADPAQAAIRKPTNIPAQGLAPALQLLARERDIQVVYRSDLVKDRQTSGATGELTIEETLTRLLSGTGLTFQFLEDRGITIVPIATSTPSRSAPATKGVKVPLSQAGDAPTGFWERFKLAQADSPSEEKSAATTASGPVTLEEVVVSANRRLQRSQDVAATLQVFSGRDLDKRGAQDFSDYLLSVPTVSLREQGNGATRIALRGVSNVAGNDLGDSTVSTVGLYLNDVSIQGTCLAPDVALYDIARVEVLKGPQGTLYGEGAMGGAIKMILNEPDASRFEGKGDLTVSATESGGLNYRPRAVINVPLIADRLALRVAGTYLDESGFVDNTVRNEDDADDRKIYSLRALLGGQITEGLNAELLAFHNQRDLGEFSQVNQTLGTDRIDTTEDRMSKDRTDVFALTLKGDVGFADLSSITSYYKLDREFVDKLSFGSFFFGAGSIFYPGTAPVTQEPLRAKTDLTSKAQEFRLVSHGDQRFDWVLGAFYRDKDQTTAGTSFFAANELGALNAELAAASLPLLPSDGAYFRTHNDSSFEQFAVYGEGNLELTDHIEATVGLRWFDDKVDTDPASTGYSIIEFFSSDDPPFHLKAHGFIPKYALSYKLSKANLVYAQATKGFRSGTVNLNRPFGLGDDGADPDNLWSYELGSKNSFANGLMLLNVSAYFTDWNGIQTTLVARSPLTGNVGSFTENGGDAELYGAEVEFALAASDALSFGAAAGYAHGELTSALPGSVAVVGSSLPDVPKWTASGYAEYRQPMSLGEAFGRLDVQYSSEQLARLVTTDPSSVIYLPSYTIANARFGVEAQNGWGVTAFVDNVANRRYASGIGLVAANQNNANLVTVNRPRTYGVTVSKSF